MRGEDFHARDQAAVLTRIQFLDFLGEHRLRDDQLADHVDQAIDAVELDANGRQSAAGFRGVRVHGPCKSFRDLFHGFRRLLGFRLFAVKFFNLEQAVVGNELERFLDVLQRRFGLQLESPFEIGVFRVERFQRGRASVFSSMARVPSALSARKIRIGSLAERKRSARGSKRMA
ncbi:hypothetical protein E6W36_07925 [Hankyongella ginsenosidimutans]|uniref:Uncharacterized protein n=1 Tax=Hankyongella ginsenosidimutans TaxID=1763828 RepID=A0A4D7BVE7_9SPHN|nr:hypothetical protein [Hankyongella ginsenosidimutans]QCI79499.1 hypothetical protein E6W36_07925 [Hankyongella ginsenosidimutans]